MRGRQRYGSVPPWVSLVEVTQDPVGQSNYAVATFPPNPSQPETSGILGYRLHGGEYAGFQTLSERNL